MPVLTNISSLAKCPLEGKQSDIDLVHNAALVWDKDKIVWSGKESELPKEYTGWEQIDIGQRCVIPGLIDCHTHLAFGGWRDDEFEMRVKGKSYLEIAKAGGGILSTVKATREASEEELVERCKKFLRRIARLGVTTIECKSGYGLTLDDELKLLRVYKKLQEDTPLTIVPTFLGAHTFPAEYREKKEDYIELVVNEMLPAVKKQGLSEFCDIFVEESAFGVSAARKILGKAKELGMGLRLHVDQLSDGGGAELAAELGALSADHLERVSDAGIRAMAEAGVVAVTLPIASLYTQEKALDARRLLEAGVKVAVATDFNPGSAPSFHIQLAMMLACNLNRLSPAEALKGVTSIAASTLKLEDRYGSLEPGKQADFVVLNTSSINDWLYNFRESTVERSYKAGQTIYKCP